MTQAQRDKITKLREKRDGKPSKKKKSQVQRKAAALRKQ